MKPADSFLQRLKQAGPAGRRTGARRALPVMMGICNVTPDSFSDGGRHFGLERAKARVDELLAEGAEVIDIGGESTRPGAAEVSATEQLTRVLEVVRYAAERTTVSIDTTLPEVAEACLRAGACIVNDVSNLADAELARVAAEHRAALVLMHSRGSQSKMAGPSVYPALGYLDVVRDVVREWQEAALRAEAVGLPRERLVFDPGFGFSKSAEQSMELLLHLQALCAQVEVPVLVGASRKSFLRVLDPGAQDPDQRLGASLAAAVVAWQRGAACVRVHDVRATRQALALMQIAEVVPPGDRGDQVSHA